MSNLTMNPKVDYTIFGYRYFYEVIKAVKNIPGFAPDTYDVKVCDIVVEYKDEEPYLQFFNEPPILDEYDLKEISEKLKRGFVKDDFTMEMNDPYY